MVVVHAEVVMVKRYILFVGNAIDYECELIDGIISDLFVPDPYLYKHRSIGVEADRKTFGSRKCILADIVSPTHHRYR